MQRVFTLSFHVPGTLSADLTLKWTAPFDCTLINDSDALIVVGDSADADEYVTSAVIGDSGVPAEFDHDDFVDTAGDTHARYYPRIVDGTIVAVALDYDGAGGTAADDFTLVLTFCEG